MSIYYDYVNQELTIDELFPDPHNFLNYLEKNPLIREYYEQINDFHSKLENEITIIEGLAPDNIITEFYIKNNKNNKQLLFEVFNDSNLVHVAYSNENIRDQDFYKDFLNGAQNLPQLLQWLITNDTDPVSIKGLMISNA